MILIFGGTTEGRIAIQTLEEAGKTFYYSTKGDEQDVLLHNGIRLQGAMDAIEIETFCAQHHIKLLIDAAHPFATQLHETLEQVSVESNIPVIRFERIFPERDAEHYQERPHTKDETHRLEVHNLSFAYKKGPDIFRNVSFEAHAEDVIGILGYNGAGKTTLLSILTGLLKQQRGEVCFDGKKLTPRQRRSHSYLVMQDTDYQLFASSVEEELSLGMKDDCKEKVDETLKALELSDYRERHPASLSGGQKQRVTIGAAIVKGSPVIYFDEPTSGLDYDSMVRVSKLIEQLSSSGVIVFVVSHDFEFIVRTCTEVVQLDDDGAIQNQRLSPEILKTLSEKYFN